MADSKPLPQQQPSLQSLRRIAHLDMDAFYASVELLRRPELAGLPVGIGGRGDPTQRGVLTTANYKAREFGVRSAMPIRTAMRLCPDLVLLPVDFDEYRRMSRLFKAAIREVTDQMEDRGIDEVYIDLTALAGEDGGQALARDVQARVFAATQLTCSIGVAPNKLLAKICSELNKPNGITMLLEHEVPSRIWPLPARRINGIGPKATDKLAAMGVHTIGDLAAVPLQTLLARFGQSYGAWMHDAARGIDARPVETVSEIKSCNREDTFEVDTRDWQVIANELARLCKQLTGDLKRKQLKGKTIGVKVKFADFKVVTRDKTIEAFTDDEMRIRKAAFECLARVELKRAVRLIGVRMASFAHEHNAKPMRARPQSLELPFEH
jgi:DNA polymerase IV